MIYAALIAVFLLGFGCGLMLDRLVYGWPSR